MKSLKITLLLAVLTAVFVLTVSGTSSNEVNLDSEKYSIDKSEIQLTIDNKNKKLKKPGQQDS